MIAPMPCDLLIKNGSVIDGTGAPARPQTSEIAMRDLVNVEAIPFEVLQAGITWDWETFPQYMDAAARRKPALNLAFLAPLAPLRHFVMGEASLDRAANGSEVSKIKELLGEAMDAGAFGFSSTLLNQHLGYQGRPLACRNASREEMKAYCNALRERGKGAIEIAMTKQIGVMDEPELELLDFMLAESARPITFIAMFDRDDISEAPGIVRQLGAHHRARSKEPRAQALRRPDGRGDCGGRRKRWRRCAARPHARGRSRQRVHHAVVQHARRPHDRDPAEQGHAARPGRWRRAPRHVVRLGLSDLRARHLGARAQGAVARGGGAAHDLGPGGLLRHQGPRTPAAGPGRGRHHLRCKNRGVGRPSGAALRPAGRREAHGDALAG